MELIVLGFLIVLNGFFALSETALISSKKARLEQYKIKGGSGAKIALKLLENSEVFLSAIQVGITLIGIITGVYGGMSIADDVAPFFLQYDFTREYAHEIALSLTVIGITYISIVIGELVPKTIAMNRPEKIAIRVAVPVYYFSKIFYPFVRLLAISTNLINQLIGIKPSEGQVTEEELRHMMRFASNEGVIEKEQNRMHEKVFYFSDKKARHIMTHRKDVEWIDSEQSGESFHAKILGLKHSKIIVCRNTIDEFTGILNVKEYLINFYSPSPRKLEALLHNPLVIPENADAQKVLEIFRQKQNYTAVIVDEYGSFEGIITLHDIIENIIGNVPEEGETPEPEVFVRSDKSILVSGDAPIETLVDLIEDFDLDFEKIDYSTVAGYVFNQINKIPELGDKVILSDCTIEVVDIDNNKIDKVLITKRK
ncbi:magnesium and cobalt efflux protein CorC [Aquipluma nitroreducens]|uniref:Magnesium and cobalt efflux protein CorC n=1 Tax=Aquipluma nitroreducens TaxID=2010828 RepID=A0A5K7S747_9BACT|nr:hemolysin family protein [Aquipluma nitroreducens]BBE17372.1 magnesium and cobalt efflux protein CorC [Aquipluma nitroreducens]